MRRLEGEALELNRQNDSLQEQLHSSHQTSEEVRLRLIEELKQQQQATETAQLAAHDTLTRLESLQDEH
ncbi:hypothetical protein ACD661_16995, partial [Legionella lytica]